MQPIFMEQEPRRLEFSNPNEQLELTALVNRFCEREPEGFNPDMHLEEAIRIVKALEPRIEDSSNKTIKTSRNIHLPSSSSTMVGATELGEVKITVDNKDGKSKKFKKTIWGKVKEYRIGQYTVKKNVFNKEGVVYLSFENFWDYGRINEALENYPPFWQIVYDLKSLEVESIAKLYVSLDKRTRTIDLFFVQHKHEVLSVLYSPNVVWKAKPTN